MAFKFSHSKKIPGCLYGNIPKFIDTRGIFFKAFSENILSQLNIKFDIVETFVSISHKNVFRGMHLQIPPFDHDKLVFLLDGKVDDYIIDLRNTKLYGQSEKISLAKNKQNFIYIPRGVGHGFYSKQDNSILLYMTNSPYSPQYDTGVNIDEINFSGTKEGLIISDRDRNLPNLDYFKNYIAN